MGRATWLTWKMHRFEVVAVVGLLGLLAMSAWIVTGHITGLGLSGACWPRTEDGNYATAACDDLMNRFYGITGGEGSFVRIGLALVAPIAGLILGVPIVARELELRTTALAWSLEGIRWRWLLARAIPMLLVGSIGLLVLGAAGSLFFDALARGSQSQALTEVASNGLALVARGLLAFGIALLVGAIVGRTMPAFIVAGIAVVLWSAVGVSAIQGELSQRFAVWMAQDDPGWRAGVPIALAYTEGGQFDTTKPGVNGEPGARFDPDAVDRQVVATCGVAPDDDTGETPAYRAWAACSDPYYQRVNDASWEKVVPASRFGDYAAIDTLASLLGGGLAILLVFPVVARRRAS